jgi:PAS domain S-box-containing protein
MKIEDPADTSSFLSGGEMGSLTRTKDWSSTPIGGTDTWPQSLRTTLNMILHSRFPMFLWWGPELICFYNDAYRPSLGDHGKHPFILGQPAEIAWAEIWDVIHPLIKKVLNGESIWSEDQLIPIYRNGKLEDVYWTFSYSPVIDESGESAGVLVICQETTEKIIMLRNLKDQEDQLRFTIDAAELGHKKLKENEQKLNILIAASEFGTWELQIYTDNVIYSDRYLEIFGHESGSLVTHQNLRDQIHPLDRHIRDAAFKTAMSTGTLYFVCRLIATDGSIRWIEAKGRVFYDLNSQPEKLLGTVRDITSEKNSQRELQESEQQFRLLADSMERQVRERTFELEIKNSELKKMNAELESFAYISSHDLQEPLRKIQILSSFVIEKDYDSLSETAKEYFNRMQAAAKRMQVLIADLLTYSRTGASERVYELTDLTSLVTQVVIELKEVIEEKTAIIEMEPLGSLNIIPFQFRQLMHNLISNSLKFSKKGLTPRIQITADRFSPDQLITGILGYSTHYCRIRVADNGIGFEPEYRERVFEVFQRLHNRHEYAGTGIGLAIVKKIVENHHGVIQATAEPDSGAIFDIYIPTERI